MSTANSPEKPTPWWVHAEMYNQNHGLEGGEFDEERDVRRRTFKILKEMSAHKRQQDDTAALQHPSYRTIPVFYKPRETTGNNHDEGNEDPVEREQRREVANALRRSARARFLHRMSLKAVSEENLAELCRLLITDQPEKRIDYQQFLEVGRLCSPKLKKFFVPSAFRNVRMDESGRIDTTTYFTYICQYLNKVKTRNLLAEFDLLGQGYLRESDLVSLVEDSILKFPSRARAMAEDAHFVDNEPFYIFACVRKFFFTCRTVIRATGGDSANAGTTTTTTTPTTTTPTTEVCVPAVELLNSVACDEFFSLQEAETENKYPNNWFSIPRFANVFRLFTLSDRDMDGLLSKEEFPRFDLLGGVVLENARIASLMGLASSSSSLGGGEGDSGISSLTTAGAAATSLLGRMGGGGGALPPQLPFVTEALVERLYSENVLNEGKLEYRYYLDFILARENMKDCLGYWFRLLDVKRQGYLDTETIRIFHKDVHRAVIKYLYETDALSESAPRTEDVLNEIFDIVNPRDPSRITLADLQACGGGDLIVMFLTDPSKVWLWELRESFFNANAQNAAAAATGSFGEGQDVGTGESSSSSPWNSSGASSPPPPSPPSPPSHPPPPPYPFVDDYELGGEEPFNE